MIRSPNQGPILPCAFTANFQLFSYRCRSYNVSCRSGPHSRSCPDVCRYLHPIRWRAAILCACRAVRTAGGSSYNCCLYGSSKLSLHNPSLGETRVVLQLSRSEHHGVFPLKKYGMVSASNVFFSQPSVVFCGSQACPTSTVDDAFSPIFQTI